MDRKKTIFAFQNTEEIKTQDHLNIATQRESKVRIESQFIAAQNTIRTDR